MKNLYNLNPKSYKEGYDILYLLPKDEKYKIPKDVWKFLEENMDLHHQVTPENIYNNNLLDDTNLLLAIIYKNYLATEEEKLIINAKELSVARKKEELSYKKYNPKNLFKK